mmetsp:Transcript_6001/g.15472  ORF Transcript_6001/g.15472 Transcript_6001/m.15472 type:complete len:261 (+) Transcript_6001:168-950(+)
MPATGSSVGPRIGATRPLPRAPTSSSSVSAPPRPQKRTVARTPQPQAAGAGRRGCTGRLRAGGKPAAEAGAAPWSLLFDLRERETEWSDGNQARLVVAFAAQELGVAEEEVRRKLGELAVLMPDLSSRVGKLTPGTVTSLIRDTKVVALNMVQLKSIFPAANVSAAVAARPELALMPPEEVRREAAAVAELLGVDAVDDLVEEYPRILDAEAVSEALDMLRTLLPGQDPRATLRATPSFMSRVERGKRRLGAADERRDYL